MELFNLIYIEDLNNQAVGPVGPVGPVNPVAPVGPVNPVGPVGPVGPVTPANPVADNPVVGNDQTAVGFEEKKRNGAKT